MLKLLRAIFAAPIFPEDEDKTRKARYANAIALALIVIIFGYEVSARLTSGSTKLGIFDFIVVAVAITIMAGLRFLGEGMYDSPPFCLSASYGLRQMELPQPALGSETPPLS